MGENSAKGFTLWFTGLSASGKSTLAERVAKSLREAGRRVEGLDGDEGRTHLCRGLGFTKEGRDTNVRRIGYVAHLLVRNGIVAVAAAISPYRDVRDENRALIGEFVEVFVECRLEECRRRDPKGLYARAVAGQIAQFTGVSDPYEPPLMPEVVVRTAQETVEESTVRILDAIRIRGYVA